MSLYLGRQVYGNLAIVKIVLEAFQKIKLDRKPGVDLVRVVRQVVQQYAQPGCEIRIEAEEEPLEGTFDADRLGQVLNNLLENALKYSSFDQPVIIRVARQTGSACEVVVSVQDFGSGIRAEDQALIFERFYRVAHESAERVDGLGLGLFIVSKIVAQHGGRVWLESKPGKGSTFFFSLPLAPENV